MAHHAAHSSRNQLKKVLGSYGLIVPRSDVVGFRGSTWVSGAQGVCALWDPRGGQVSGEEGLSAGTAGLPPRNDLVFTLLPALS